MITPDLFPGEQAFALASPIPVPVNNSHDGEIKTQASNYPTFKQAELRKKIGQLIVIGFENADPKSSEILHLRQAISKGEISGLLYSGQNIPRSREEIKALISFFNDAAEKSKQPLLFHTLVHEGGRIQRLHRWHGVEPVEAAERIAQGTPDEAYQLYRNMACSLADTGFNWNLGPVVDFSGDKDNSAIIRLMRSYGPDTSTVLPFARSFIQAHRSCGMATALKHFPGYDFSVEGKNKTLVNITDAWDKSYIEPYKKLIENKLADAIITGHLLHRAFDSSHPASLSRIWIKDILVKQIDFQGLIVTDNLDVDAITNLYSLEQASIRALAAGNHLVLISNSHQKIEDLPQRIADAILKEIDTPGSLLTSKQIDSAYERVMTFKKILKVRLQSVN